jgi:hypothetical protein
MSKTLRLALIAFALATPLAAHAEELNLIPGGPSEPFGFNAGDKGLVVGLPAGGGPTVGFSYLLSSSAAVEANIGLGLQFTTPSAFDFSVELGYRKYLGRVGSRLFPFFQPGVFFSHANSVGEVALEAGVGVEYFLLEHFSIAAATGLALQFTNLGGNGSAGVSLTTGTTGLFADFYF